MKKSQQLEQYLAAYGSSLSSAEVFHIVHEIFGFDLDRVPLLIEGHESQRSACDEYLEQLDGSYTRQNICRIVNQLYGVNLEALCALEGAQLSLFAKGKWVLTSADDFFVVFSGDGDRVARVFTTPYYTEQNGSSSAPEGLRNALVNMGYISDATGSQFVYQTADDRPVPDAFKGQTIGALRQAIAAIPTPVH
ncbi:hypothetical protein ACFO0S_11205 [Chryseomicrobium palamuruense]|uniref:Uncharacterized protein n=1 Tax=Chryseomicrobium palamuruense TaxID=682973 RepID=A0ABV8UXA6_9BACL